MVDIDGHELSIATTVFSLGFLIDRTLPNGWVRHLIHRHPMGAMSVAMGLTGVLMPLVVPKVRRALGWPTNQYDATHPDVVYPKYIEELREDKN